MSLWKLLRMPFNMVCARLRFANKRLPSSRGRAELTMIGDHRPNSRPYGRLSSIISSWFEAYALKGEAGWGVREK